MPTRLPHPLAPALSATLAEFVDSRPPGADEDVHMIPRIVDHIITSCTRPGQLVVDPFAGFGTTLARAMALGRRAVGVELLPGRVAYIREHVPGSRILLGNALELQELVSEPASLIVSSPPYLAINDHAEDPLTGYQHGNSNYQRYLTELGDIAAQCATILKPGGHLVWNVADIRQAGVLTPLIDGCYNALQEHLTPVGVLEIEWDQLPHDLSKDALIVLRKPT